MLRAALTSRKNPLSMNALSALAAALALGAHPLAYAQSVPWSISANANVTAPGSAQAAYGSGTGGSTTVTVSDPALTPAATAVPSTPAATTANVSASIANNAGAVLTGASAGANLSTGTLTLDQFSNPDQPAAGFRAGSSSASAALTDTLTFNLPAVAGITNIDVTWTFDARLAGTLGSSTGGVPLGNGSGTLDLAVSMNGASFEEMASYVGGGTGFVLSAPAPTGWAAFTQSKLPANTLGAITFQGVLAISNLNPIVTLSAVLSNGLLGNCSNGAACSAMASVVLGLPSGVTYTSASNAFLAGPVPEPSTWGLLLAGVGTLLVSRRRLAGRPAPTTR